MDQIFQTESQHLLWTQEQYDRLLADSQEFFAALPQLYPGDPDLLGDLQLQTHNRIAKLRRGRDKPYFARIDFAEDGQGQERYYIGRMGVTDNEERLITLDWRAPVSTLYYDSNVGPVAYTSPTGPVTGELRLKRQLEVEGGQLLACRDVDTVANDELLRPYLGVSADNRLKNIIATIQSEQNRIIRADIRQNLIVQGAAGSGKTTVALHRIAYLVYHYRQTVRPEQFLVIGPNRVFMEYISSVLPDLDVDSVPQSTYAELVRQALGEDFQVADPGERLYQVIQKAETDGVQRHKTSMAYKAALDRFLLDFEQELLPPGGFSLRGFPVLGREDMLEGWKRGRENGGDTIRARVEHCVLYLSGLVENRELLLDNQLSAHFRALYADRASAGLDQLHRDRAWIERELAGGCRKSLSKHLSGWNRATLSLYRQFLTRCQDYLSPGFAQAAALKKQTLSSLRRRLPEGEDLPALLYLRERVQGCGGYKGFRHAVVDEAQDFGEFDLYALQKALGECTFTVVGDLAQSVYAYRSVESWTPVLQQSFDKGATLLEMNVSYRTTVEIMQAANRVTAVLGLTPCRPVIRHGPPVRLHRLRVEEQARRAAELVKQYRQDSLASIALLCKTEGEVAEAAGQLRRLGLELAVIDSQSGPYDGGLCAMTGYQAKGLEFDGVLLWEGSTRNYDVRRAIDMHLLYVAMTRPLHRLEILCTGEPCGPLADVEAACGGNC